MEQKGKDMNKIKPISPKEIDNQKDLDIPDEVIAAFNELIIKKLNGDTAVITQGEALSLCLSKLKAANKKMTSEELFDYHYLDVEQNFRKAGWKVEYDKPGYNERYEGFYTFSKSKSS